MSAGVFAAITAFPVIGFGKNHKAVLEVVIFMCVVLWLILIL
jgi:hypothetical protein